MTERWKRWKAKSGLSTVSTAPWKSRTPREISTFPQLGRTADGKSGKPKPGFPLFPRAIRDYESGWRVPKPRRSGPAASRRSRAKMQRKPPSFGRQKGYRQFRPISGSLFDWKMLQGLLSPVICEVVLARKYLRVWYLTALRGSEFPVSPLFYRRALEGRPRRPPRSSGPPIWC